MKKKFGNVFDKPIATEDSSLIITNRDTLIDELKKTIDKIILPILKLSGQQAETSTVSSSFSQSFCDELYCILNIDRHQKDENQSIAINLIAQDLEPGNLLDK